MQHNDQSPHSEGAVFGGPTDFKTTSELAPEGHMGPQALNSVDSDQFGNEKQLVNEQEAGRAMAPTSKYDIFGGIKYIWHRYKLQCCMAIWLLITAYFIASMALKEKTQLSDILPFILLYVFITFKMLFAFVDTALITKPVGKFYDSAVTQRLARIPVKFQYMFGSVVLLALVLGVSLGLPDSENGSQGSRMQSLLGIAIITLLLVFTSRNPREIQWRTVIVGYLMQFCLGCIVVKTSWGNDLFNWIATRTADLLRFSRYGTVFLLGDKIANLGVFSIAVFSAIIFFSAFAQMIYYLGGIQWLLKCLGWFFQKSLDTSGAESIVAAASPFIGQSENVLLVKDYLEHMTNSEIHACMTAGFATISGSTLQAYITIGVSARNIITACIMSIPCSLALSKIRYPETEESLTRGKMVEPPKHTDEANVLHALGNGAAVGINLSLLIAANLIAIISLVNLVNFFLTWFGQFITIDALTLELILSYLLYPYAWLLGVPKADILKVSQLLGLKFITNEFVAYMSLNVKDAVTGVILSETMTTRGRIIAEFSLCGFGNLGSIAQQIGALGSLAPSRKADFSRLALSACITGSIATTLTAAIVSMVM
ncbi:hypothetical protein FBU59_002180 [Linderina macrospora]|uniref:Uncharacterized protein n=1 Tax=Linderina macrospora TaxID=4868 RepID=A0ACC1JC80_9FUNG|nr:hypothetical protein FBU59_002180 [Linderina macrospora]